MHCWGGLAPIGVVLIHLCPQNALQLFNTTRSAPRLGSTKGHNGAGHGLRGGFSNGGKKFHQSVWLHQRGPASETDWSFHQSSYAGRQSLLGSQEDPWGLFAVTGPNTNAGGRQSGQSRNFIQVAELLRLIVQAELHLGHPG